MNLLKRLLLLYKMIKSETAAPSPFWINRVN